MSYKPLVMARRDSLTRHTRERCNYKYTILALPNNQHIIAYSQLNSLALQGGVNKRLFAVFYCSSIVHNVLFSVLKHWLDLLMYIRPTIDVTSLVLLLNTGLDALITISAGVATAVAP